MTWWAFGADTSLPFEDLALDSVVEGAKTEVPFLSVKDIGVDASFVRDLVVLHQLSNLGFQYFWV